MPFAAIHTSPAIVLRRTVLLVTALVAGSMWRPAWTARVSIFITVQCTFVVHPDLFTPKRSLETLIANLKS